MTTSPFMFKTDQTGAEAFFCLSALLIALVAGVFATSADARSLTIDDVLAIQTIDGADISPVSDDIAISIPRPAGSGEVYGRNAYEIDPSRNDIWLVRRDGTGARAITAGRADAAGYWCPHWSPDGKRLAMLSTAPQGNEPRGGANVRLYVWERESDGVSKVSDRALVTQVRYGSPLNALDMRAAGSRQPSTCRQNDENAPFLWLDGDRLLVLLMPTGQRSAMVDRYAKFHREAARAGTQIRAGKMPTVSRSDSADAAASEPSALYEAKLVVFNVSDGSQTTLGGVPAFPMFGALTLALSPDAKRAAILSPLRAIAPHLLSPDRPNSETWAVEKALYHVTLDDPSSLRRAALPAAARYPVDMIGWSPGARHVAFRARARPDELSAGLWSLDADAGTVTALAPDLQLRELTPSHQRDPGYALWAGKSRMLVNGTRQTGENEWRLVDAQSGQSEPFSSGIPSLNNLRSLSDGTLVGRSNGGSVRFDPKVGRFVPREATADKICQSDEQLVVSRGSKGTRYTRFSAGGAAAPAITAPDAARILDHDCTGIVWVENGFEGSSILFSAWDARSDQTVLMERNRHLAQVNWGARRMIEYTHANGSAQKMAVMFPPDHDPDKAYPTLFWVYGGYSPGGTDNFFFDPHMSAFYNLQLYASQGYVVVVPAIPIERGDKPSEPFAEIPGGVIPALDKLVELGITDNARVGVFGQSFGGYTVSSLIAQTDRFAAAATLAGATDLATTHASFDPSARGWPGVAQDMDANEQIYEAGLGFKVDPGVDPDLYERNSPLTYAKQINTPLLLIHGELDSRAPLTQPETLYSLLRRRGRTARLLRYWGENHSLANSPANVRDISRELIDWFDRHVKKQVSRIE